MLEVIFIIGDTNLRYIDGLQFDAIVLNPVVLVLLFSANLFSIIGVIKVFLGFTFTKETILNLVSFCHPLFGYLLVPKGFLLNQKLLFFVGTFLDFSFDYAFI
jgi:hypothetical protein